MKLVQRNYLSLINFFHFKICVYDVIADNLCNTCQCVLHRTGTAIWIQEFHQQTRLLIFLCIISLLIWSAIIISGYSPPYKEGELALYLFGIKNPPYNSSYELFSQTGQSQLTRQRFCLPKTLNKGARLDYT